MQCAETEGDESVVGRAHYRLGCALLEASRPTDAKDHLLAYIQRVENLGPDGDLDGSQDAYRALSDMHLDLGDVDAALDALQKYLRSAKRAENLKAQADACSKLGFIYLRQHLYGRAVEYFSQSFNTIRSLFAKKAVSQKDLNTARINLGTAKSSLAYQSILGAVKSEKIGGLLKWKNTRISL